MTKSLGRGFTWLVAAWFFGCNVAEKDGQYVQTQYGSFDPVRQPLPDIDAPVPAGASSYIVQFAGPIQRPWRDAATATGASVQGYLPSSALVMQGTPIEVERLQRLPFVRAVVAQPRVLKLDPRLTRVSSAGLTLSTARPTHDVLVQIHGNADLGALQQVLRTMGAITPAVLRGHVLRARVPSMALGQLAASPYVAAVAPYFPPRLLNDRSFGIVQAGRKHASPIWEHGILGGGQVVALSDSGVDTRSCFFKGDKIAHYEDLTDAKDEDGDGHGTHVAGSIAGDKEANGAYDLNDGMAPAARLYVQDVADGSDLVGIPDDLAPLFASAYDFGARLHSNSWGDDDSSYSIISRSVDEFVDTHRDLLILFAVGNSGSYDGTVGSPATAKNIVTVGALYGSAPDDIAYFSSHGPTADGRIKPLVAAPGVSIISARRKTACGTASKSGTSMATPVVAGAAALVRQYFTDGFYPSGLSTPADAFVPSAALLKSMLMAGAQDMPGSDTGGNIPSNGQGFGRVHLAGAMRFAEDSTRLWVRDEGVGLETGDTERFTLHVKRSGPLKVALAWTDRPASAGAQTALVNDLDLTVAGPEGEYRGNALKRGVSTAEDKPLLAKRDTLNVEELVFLSDAEPGDYTVSVTGSSIPLGPQTYALVAVGAMEAADR